MKIKDIKGNMGGVKVKTPKGVVGIWKSQWDKGVWLSDGKTTRIYPQHIDDLRDCLEWDVVEDEINCDKERKFDVTDNRKNKI